jgi:hypothetical protein
LQTLAAESLRICIFCPRCAARQFPRGHMRRSHRVWVSSAFTFLRKLSRTKRLRQKLGGPIPQGL